MQVLLFYRKKCSFNDGELRMFRYFTELAETPHLEGIRLLRCLIVSDVSDFDAAKLQRTLADATEEFAEEKWVRAEADKPDCAFLSTVSLFRRPGEALTEQAARLAVNSDTLSLRHADVYLIYGKLTEEEQAAIRCQLVNPASCTEISLLSGGILPPFHGTSEDSHTVVRGFDDMRGRELADLRIRLGLRLSGDDMRFIQSYYHVAEKREPTLFELRFLDCYWSDHCRHTTFLTSLEDLQIDDMEISETFRDYLAIREEYYGTAARRVSLMDIATIAAKANGVSTAEHSQESAENNAFSTVIPVRLHHDDGTEETTPWLLFFKNESHNYPTMREPFIGAENSFAATSADVMSARGNVFASMRLSAVSPNDRSSEEDEKNLSQSRHCRDAADGFASFGLQTDIPVGYVWEWEDKRFGKKPMEVCMTAGAVPLSEHTGGKPVPGDAVLLIGADTAMDGMGGAVRASATVTAIRETEPYTARYARPGISRSLLRFFERKEVRSRIKRSSDVGSGGLATAVAEIAPGVRLDLDAVPTAEGAWAASMNAFAVALSETQSRFILLCSANNAELLKRAAAEEGVSCTTVGTVTEDRRVRMFTDGIPVLNLERDFLDSTGAERQISADIPQEADTDLTAPFSEDREEISQEERLTSILQDPEVSCKKDLVSRFSSGHGAVIVQYGGKSGNSQTDFMAYRIPVTFPDTTDTCAVFSCGYAPSVTGKSPYFGGYLSVLTAVCRMAAAGVPYRECRLSLQEYFPTVRGDPKRYGTALAAMLGAFRAQIDLGVYAIGGKDSMAGTEKNVDVPPTVIAFAAAGVQEDSLLTPEFKQTGSRVYLLEPTSAQNGMPDREDLCALLRYLSFLQKGRKLLSCKHVGFGGVGAAIALMSLGSDIGFNFELPSKAADADWLYRARYGAFLVETDTELRGEFLGHTKDSKNLFFGKWGISIPELSAAWKKTSVKHYGTQISSVTRQGIVCSLDSKSRLSGVPAVLVSHPRVLVPVFPGTAGEKELCNCFCEAGFEPEKFLFRTGTLSRLQESIRVFADKWKSADILAFAGGGSSCYGSISTTIPDPSLRFVAVLFHDQRLAEMREQFAEDAGHLVLGIGAGFPMLVSAGFFGTAEEPCPVSFTENLSGHPQAGFTHLRICSESSPFLRYCRIGESYLLPVASQTGRCLVSDDNVLELTEFGQIAAQYADGDGNPSMKLSSNPFGSDYAVAGLLSRNGRTFGCMAELAQIEKGLYRNLPERHDMRIFRAAADYYGVRH